MEEPRMYRDAGVTYCVPPFTAAEQIGVDCHRMQRMTYAWKHKPTGRTGSHTVYVFHYEVKRFPDLISRWNLCMPDVWEYSFKNNMGG